MLPEYLQQSAGDEEQAMHRRASAYHVLQHALSVLEDRQQDAENTAQMCADEIETLRRAMKILGMPAREAG